MHAGAVELRNEISRAVGLELPGTLVFDYPSIMAISQFIMTKLGPATTTSSVTTVMATAVTAYQDE